MSPTVLKAFSIFGFWAMVMLICPLPLYSSYFNHKILLTNNNEQPVDEMSEVERLRRRHIIARRTRIANLVCSLSNSLSGGLFVSLGIIHLLPEAAEAFNGLYDEETIDKFRPAFATAFCSYTLLLLLQRVVFGEHGHSHGGGDHEEVDEHDHHHHSHGDHPPHHGDHSLVVEQHHGGLPKTAQSSRLTTSNTTGAYGATTSTRATMDSEHTGSCQQRQRHDSDVRRDTAPFLSGRAASTRSSTRSSIVVGDIDGSFAAARSSIRASTNRADVMVRIVLDNTAPDEAAVQYHDNDSTAIGYHAAPNNDSTTTAAAAAPVTKVVTSLVLMLAFSLHGIAEGMALGVQEESNSVTLMILAIALHKWAEALSIGMSFQRSGLAPARCMVYIIAFSFSSPLGIGVGWVSEALLPEVLSAYLMAFSTGTFLYLGASDAVVEEFAHGSGGGVLRRWLKFGFYMCGAVLIFLISAFLDRDGDDGNSGSGGDDA